MGRETILRVINMLQEARQRPGMFFELQPLGLYSFLSGVQCTCRLFGIEQARHFREEVLIKRGWQYTAKAPWVEMEERGFDPLSVIEEILQIEIEVWERTYHHSLE